MQINLPSPMNCPSFVVTMIRVVSRVFLDLLQYAASMDGVFYNWCTRCAKE